MKKLAIVTTHPIQYYAPVFRLLTERGKIQVKVFYTQAPESTQFDKGFGRKVEWDIPLLEGYDYEFHSSPSQLLNSLKAFHPHSLLIFGWNSKNHLRLMRHFHGRILVWFRGDSTLLDEKPGLRTTARRLFLRWVYSHVDKAFYVGTNNKAYFLAHGLREGQLVFAPHAIDNERFADNEARQYEARAAAWRQELGISKEDTVILFAGKLEPKKDPLLLIAAVQGLNKTLPRPLKLILVGNGVLEEAVRESVSNDPNLRWLGFQNQSQMPVVYRLGDVFCLPSKGPGETWGLAVNEAMACGRGVVISKLAGASDDLGKVPFNKVFQAGDIRDLTNCLKELSAINNPEAGKVSRDFIRDWSFEKQAEAFERAWV